MSVVATGLPVIYSPYRTEEASPKSESQAPKVKRIPTRPAPSAPANAATQQGSDAPKSFSPKRPPPPHAKANQPLPPTRPTVTTKPS